MPFVIGLGIGLCIVVVIISFVSAVTGYSLRDFARLMRGGEWY